MFLIDEEKQMHDAIKEGKTLYDFEPETVSDYMIRHLSVERANIVNWYPFKTEDKVLLFDAEYGEIISGISEKVAKLDAVYYDETRKKFSKERNHKYQNVEYYLYSELDNTDYNYVVASEDVIQQSGKACREYIQSIMRYISESGRLLLITENKLAHRRLNSISVNVCDNGLEYREVEDAVESLGLVCSKVYYPYPDSIYPTEIFTDETINGSAYGRAYVNLTSGIVSNDRTEGIVNSFNENKVAKYYANAYLFEISRFKNSDNEINYVKISSDRNPKFQIYTTVYNDKVIKSALTSQATEHINRVANLELNEENVSILPGKKLNDASIEYKFLELDNLDDNFQKCLSRGDYEGCYEILRSVFERLLANPEEVDYRTPDFEKVFGVASTNECLLSKKNLDIDIILDNIFLDDKSFVIIDPEWTFDFYIPVKYVMWRVLNECYSRYPKLGLGIRWQDMIERFDISESLVEVFRAWEIHFTNEYIGAGKIRAYERKELSTLDKLLINRFGSNTETSTLFITNQKVTHSAHKKDNDRFEFCFKLAGETGDLRWDPCEHSCVCRDVVCYADGKFVDIEPLNAFCRIKNKDYFTTEDPAFCIHLGNCEVNELRIEVEVVPLINKEWNEIYEDSCRRIDELYEESSRHIAELNNELWRIHNSKLWNVFRMKNFVMNKLRWAKRMLKGVRNRVRHIRKMHRQAQNGEIVELLQKHLNREYEIPKYDETIDVIVPIYNGYDYLVKLFPTLLKTEMNTRIFLVDDKSPDERVHQIEAEFAAEHDNVFVINNEENYGFVKSVNNALIKTENHVALVNTDTELPEFWLERLMQPIIEGDKIGSTTPYTNSGTIFSFPNFCYNNDIYRDMTVEEIDSYFKMVRPVNAVAPTGVGFCMGMNRKALDEVGTLDYETFSKGFGEENDWCQRAVRKGYKNVHVENLFVYHKHGGSFQSKEKEELLKHNVAIVNKRYPNYPKDVNAYILKDQNREIRELGQIILDMRDSKSKSILAFDHMLGGGATAYLENKIREHVEAGDSVSVIRYDYKTNHYYFYYKSLKFAKDYYFKNFDEVLVMADYFHFDEIYVNELVTYPYMESVLNTIVALKNKTEANMVLLGHDYFALCPSINLMGEDDKYCDFPSEEKCNQCFKDRNYNVTFHCESAFAWRKLWKDFTRECDEVRSFSEDTKLRLETLLECKDKSTLVPHKVEYMFPIEKKYKTSDTFNIGVLGHLALHKGSAIVREMLDELEAREIQDVRIVLIGQTEEDSLLGYKNFKQTGTYKAEDVVQLTYENDIDAYLIPSVWPETFSYTTEEIIQMNLPVACFDIGAPAERVKKYGKGIIVSEMTGKAVLDAMINRRDALVKPRVDEKKHVVYVVEFKSFSSRYRIEHMKEELLAQGIDGEIWYTDNLPKNVKWEEISCAVIYRCRDLKPVTDLIEQFKNHSISIAYDIDDLIFNYETIKNLPFMKDPEYKDFNQYSKDIDRCIQKCDVLLTSTDTLKDELAKAYSDKTVILNRNRASAAMAILSMKARLQKNKYRDSITLGYFSGSHTHNGDFELIDDVLLELMKENRKVKLLIVGCLVLDSKFDQVADQIERIDFVDWRRLPEIISKCDINLMPLESTVFHQSKSENKWMEAGFVEVPTVASFNPEIDNNTRNGIDIVLCKSIEDWRAALKKMIEDEDYRKAIAKSAYEHVLESKVTVRENELWEAISKEIK